MHDGIFAGAKRFNQTQVHICQLCGFQAHNPAYFCVVDCCGVPPEKSQQSTDDFMVNQLSETFNFLKQMPKEDLARLKKEIHQIMNGCTAEEMSEVSKQVSKTMDDFRNQANQGMLTREYQDSREVIKSCRMWWNYPWKRILV